MPDKEFKPGVQITGKNVQEAEEERNVVEEEFTEEESRNQMRLQEEDFIQGLIDAAGYITEERQTVEIIRAGKLYFRFDIRPLAEEEYNRCKKKHTKYVRNKQFGIKFADSTDNSKYRSALIYQATVEEDRERLWDNKKVWEALRNMGLQIMNGLDVIEYSLKAGEKDKVLEAIDSLSGYEENLEEVAKN